MMWLRGLKFSWQRQVVGSTPLWAMNGRTAIASPSFPLSHAPGYIEMKWAWSLAFFALPPLPPKENNLNSLSLARQSPIPQARLDPEALAAKETSYRRRRQSWKRAAWIELRDFVRFRASGLWLGGLPIVSIVAPFFGLTKYIIRIL